jgi:hypothetical protein
MSVTRNMPRRRVRSSTVFGLKEHRTELTSSAAVLGDV